MFFACSYLAFGQSVNWQTSPNDYEHSMSLTCVVLDQDSNYLSQSATIGVFDYGNTCVGLGYLSTFFPPINANIGFITIFSNELQNNYTIKVLVNETPYEAGNIQFIANDIVGTIIEPFIINPSYVGCVDSLALNFNPNAIQDDGMCIFINEGCTDSTMFNFNPLANTDDESCVSFASGCYNPLFLEYDSIANYGNQDILCFTEIIPGCTNDCFVEFYGNANQDDGSCNITWHQAYSILLNENLSSCSSIQIDLPSGWCLIGYTSSQEEMAPIALDCILDKVIILKDYLGAVYLPDYDFNGLGSFIPGFGYQIKLTEPVDNFKFCE